VLYDNMKPLCSSATADQTSISATTAGFLFAAKHTAALIIQAVPPLPGWMSKVEAFNGYLRRSFYVPLVSHKPWAGLQLDTVTTNSGALVV
jgi:transposase